MKKKLVFLIVIIILFLIVAIYKPILPSSFTMEVRGNFTSSGGSRLYEATLVSSRDTNLTGIAHYYASSRGGDGFTIECIINDGRWVTSAKREECDIPLVELATTRTGLITQIKAGQLKPIGEKCNRQDLCYELK